MFLRLCLYLSKPLIQSRSLTAQQFISVYVLLRSLAGVFPIPLFVRQSFRVWSKDLKLVSLITSLSLLLGFPSTFLSGSSVSF